MAFFNSAVGTLQTVVIALGAGLGVWGMMDTDLVTIHSQIMSVLIIPKTVNGSYYSQSIKYMKNDGRKFGKPDFLL